MATLGTRTFSPFSPVWGFSLSRWSAGDALYCQQHLHQPDTFLLQVHNYSGPLRVRISLVTKSSPHKPHPHELVGKDCKHGYYEADLQERRVHRYVCTAACTSLNCCREGLQLDMRTRLTLAGKWPGEECVCPTALDKLVSDFSFCLAMGETLTASSHPLNMLIYWYKTSIPCCASNLSRY